MKPVNLSKRVILVEQFVLFYFQVGWTVALGS